jgi:PAS domain S-box-containing protein
MMLRKPLHLIMIKKVTLVKHPQLTYTMTKIQSIVPNTFRSSTTDDTLRHLAFDKSIQANIISIVSSGKIIMANSAACKLLGYSKKALLTKNRSTIFDIAENSFKIMLKQRTAEGHSIALVTAIKKSGKSIPCEITSSVFWGEHNIKKSIFTILDMSQGIQKQKNIDAKNEKRVADNIIIVKSKQKIIDAKNEKIVAHNIVIAKSKQKNIDIKREKIVAENIILAQSKSDARLAENNEWIKCIAEASYDVMWDWDISTGLIYVGDSIEEVFGCKVQNHTVNFTDFIHCLLPEEKEGIKKTLLKTIASGSKSWNDSFKFKRMDGSVASTTSRASIVRNEKGKVIRLIGAIKDISILQELEKKLNEQIAMQKEQSERYLLAAKISFDGIWDWNLLTNDFFLGEGFEELFGYTVKSTAGNISDWSNHLHPDDKESVEKGLQDAIVSTASHWEHAYRFIKANGSIANVYGRASIIRDSDGKAYRMIGAVHDISKQKVLEEKLEQEMKLKEQQIAEAAEEGRETERSNIGKELHDNVNQLLGASRLYLGMAKNGGENSEMYFSRSSEYTLTAIEEIRKLTKVLTTDVIKNLGLCESIDNIVRDTMEVNPVKISCALKSFKENSVNEKFKLNVFRIVQEGLNNILKHAHATEVTIRLIQNKKSIILAISDNGIGFDTTNKSKGIGVRNIINRAELYKGNASFISQPGEGCFLTVTFPVETNESSVIT